MAILKITDAFRIWHHYVYRLRAMLSLFLCDPRYLSVNNNKISSLVTFVDLLKKQCPKLRWISMLNNDACPNYFNQGTVAEYNEYRLYLIAHLATLKIIDSLRITDKERERATREMLERYIPLPLRF